MVGFLTGFARRTSENLRTLQNKADDTIKSYALQAAQDAKEVRKQRVKSQLDYSNMAKALSSSYGLNDGQVQALLRGGLQAGQRYIDGFDVAKSNDDKVTAASYRDAILRQIDGVDSKQQVRNIADQARYFAQMQNPNAGEDIETFASNIADSTQTLIGGVPMSYIKSGIESQMRAQMGGRVLQDKKYDEQLPQYTIESLSPTLEKLSLMADLKKVQTETESISMSTLLTKENINVSKAQVKQIDARIKNLDADTKLTISKKITEGFTRRNMNWQRNFKAEELDFKKEQAAADQKRFEDNLKLDKEKFKELKKQHLDDFGIKSQQVVSEIAYRKHLIEQSMYQNPEQVFGALLVQENTIKQEIETLTGKVGAEEKINELEGELKMVQGQQTRSLVMIEQYNTAKDTTTGRDFSYFNTFVSLRESSRQEYGRNNGGNYNARGELMSVMTKNNGIMAKDDFLKTDEGKQWVKNRDAYVEKEGRQAFSGNTEGGWLNDAAKYVFEDNLDIEPGAADDPAQVTEKLSTMSLEQIINDTVHSEGTFFKRNKDSTINLIKLIRQYANPKELEGVSNQDIVDKIAEIIKNPSIGASSEEKEEDNFEDLDYQNIMDFSNQKLSKENLSEEIKNQIKFDTKSLSTSIKG